MANLGRHYVDMFYLIIVLPIRYNNSGNFNVFPNLYLFHGSTSVIIKNDAPKTQHLPAIDTICSLCNLTIFFTFRDHKINSERRPKRHLKHLSKYIVAT